MARISFVLLILASTQALPAQTGPFTVKVRPGIIDTTCYPDCSHPTEWSLELFADIFDGGGNLVPPSTAYQYEWGTDFCRGFGFVYGWAVGMGLSTIHPDGNKIKNEPGCCTLCPYQTYLIGVRVTINGTTVESPRVRIPDGVFVSPGENLPAFPNPFRLTRGSPLTLPIRMTAENIAAVFVFTSTLDLELARDYRITESFGLYAISIPAEELRSRLQSGVHFVVARLKGGEEYRWKVAVVQ